jgi:phospholipid transport system substrate-binding protein
MKVLFFRSFLVTCIGFLSLSVSANTQINQSDPVEMVKDLSNGILDQLVTKRAEFIAEPEKVVIFAKSYILPYVDNYKMARYVMGKKWKTASKKQQQDFADAFTETILRSYSDSLIKLKIEKIEVTKVLAKRKGRKSITTEVTQTNGEQSTVIYRAYQNKKTKKWLLYDFSVEGISLLVNYRKTFASEFAKKGVEQVILNMQEKLERKEIARGGE